MAVLLVTAALVAGGAWLINGERTDAANASLKTTAPVVEGFGLRGFGSHSTNAEYVLSASIEPRLYLTARMIMDISTGKAPLR